jgi:hypothetical protein
MPDPELNESKHVIDEFAHRVGLRIRDFVVQGGFSESYRLQDANMKRRAESERHPVFAAIITDMLQQFISYNDREAFRDKGQHDERLPHDF